FSNLFQSLFEAPKKPASGKACPSCKTTWRELASRGRPGCPQCYLTCGEELEPTLRSMHGNTTHTGRAPAKASEKRERESRLAALRREMSEAIASENFERAATLRDEIRALEQK
ncbi:MAG: UvrB/UvrC motif-containing protein, partial [Clostridia bacterium]|nr:UvrB/UvrC motif-containing protein [Clostridia bacterium]